MMISLKRILNSAKVNISRNMGLSLAAIFIISVTLIFVASIFVIKDFAQLLISDVEDKINISVYFKEGVDETTILELKEEILEIEETKSVDYFSRSDVFDDFVERHKNDPIIMASLAEVGNPFLASLSIKSENQEGYENIVLYLTESPSRIFIEKIDYDQRKDVIDNIFSITSLVRRVSTILVIVLSIIAVLIVFNVIRLAIYGMREEIKIMRLVGVSPNFIRGLFISQGLIIGVISFLFCFLTVFGFGLLFGERLAILIPGLDVFNYLKNNFIFISLIQLLIGIGLGVFSSTIAIAKYLKN